MEKINRHFTLFFEFAPVIMDIALFTAGYRNGYRMVITVIATVIAGCSPATIV